MWISTNSWCGYSSVVRCWFQKQREDSHSWCQKTLKPTWTSFLFGNRSVSSFSTGKDGWSQWFCAFLAAIHVSQHGTSHGQEDFPDVHFFFSSYLVDSLEHPVPNPVWILYLVSPWVKLFLRLVSAGSAACKLIVDFVYQLYHSPTKSLQFAYVFSVYRQWMVPCI